MSGLLLNNLGCLLDTLFVAEVHGYPMQIVSLKIRYIAMISRKDMNTLFSTIIGIRILILIATGSAIY